MTTAYPLSPQQSALWRCWQSSGAAPGSAHCTITIAGELDVHRLERALVAVVTRHTSLRTSFRVEPGMSVPLQVPEAVHDWALEIVPDTLGPQRDALRSRPGASPLQAALFANGSGQWRLTLAVDARCCDEASFQLLVSELAAQYDANTAVEHAPSVDYA